MQKKYYPFLLLLGSFLIFLIFPIFNYVIDQRRTLHVDYHYSYNGIPINKSFLKTSYLLDNKNRYDTLLLGSSRNAAFKTSLVSPHAYNMESTFAVVGTHLHNLKILLKNNVKINHIWLGLNDFDIWKNPNDFENDYERKTYKNNFLDKFDFYKFYLLKKVDKVDIDILLGKVMLSKSNRILYEEKKEDNSSIKNKIMSSAKKSAWITKMTRMGGTTLGYKDTSYRIDNLIGELQQIDDLCKKHSIKLTLFLYPTFYKTYIQYNQERIEEFKRKLIKISNFHDFYTLNELSFNELNWSDSSHFTHSIGDYIIKSIKNDTYLITPKTIDNHLDNAKTLIKKLIAKNPNIKYIQRFNPHIDLSNLNVIYQLNHSGFPCEMNEDYKTDKKRYSNGVEITRSNPILTLNQTITTSKNVILTYRIESNKKTIFQIFYKKRRDSKYNENDSYRVTLRKGYNEINLLIPALYVNNTLRVDLISNIGVYTIKELKIYE